MKRLRVTRMVIPVIAVAAIFVVMGCSDSNPLAPSVDNASAGKNSPLVVEYIPGTSPACGETTTECQFLEEDLIEFGGDPTTGEGPVIEEETGDANFLEADLINNDAAVTGMNIRQLERGESIETNVIPADDADFLDADDIQFTP